MATPLSLQVTPRYVLNDHRGGISQDIIGWDDITGGVQQGTGVGSLTTEVFRDTPFLMSFFRSGQNDSLSFIYQFPHRWRPGTIIRPHMHVMPCADPAVPQNAYFTGQYCFTDPRIAAPANAGWTQITSLLTVNPGDVFKTIIVDLTLDVGITPPEGIVESGLFLLFVRRSGANVLDTYSTGKSSGTAAANLGLVSFDVHIQCEKPGGTLNEIPPPST